MRQNLKNKPLFAVGSIYSTKTNAKVELSKLYTKYKITQINTKRLRNPTGRSIQEAKGIYKLGRT